MTMAFISASPLSPSTSSLAHPPRSPRRAAPSALAKSHAHGNGGVDNRVDWTGFDADALKAEIAEAEEKLSMQPAQATSPWVVLMNSDIIQSRNNLFAASQESGQPALRLEMDNVVTARFSENSMRRAVEDDLQHVWLVQADGNGPYVEVHINEADVAVLCFSRFDEADRFAQQMNAEEGDTPHVAPIKHETIAVRETCVANEKLVGLVPSGTLVSPSMLGFNAERGAN